MTRHDILKTYTVENGRILDPGKFEGEMIYAPYFYDAVLNGGSDDSIDEHNGSVTDVFIIRKDDLAEFPELNGVYAMLVNECSNGFAYCSAVSKAELDAIMQDIDLE